MTFDTKSSPLIAREQSTGNGSNSSAKVDTKIAYIDDIAYEINDGETILSFIRRVHGNELVPTLCDAPNLEPFGSCRVCSVDVALTANGSCKSQASCHTPVMQGSYIYPSSDRVQKLRKNLFTTG